MERTMINSLLAKLSPDSPFVELLGEYSTDAQQGIAFIRNELIMINDSLEVLGEPTVQAKLWMRQLREMVFDIEDWIDNLMRQTENKVRNIDRGIMGLMRKLKKMRSREKISSNIRYFKAYVEAVSQRNQRYNLVGPSSRRGGLSDPSAAMASIPRSPFPVELGDLVGIDGLRMELLDLLGGEEKQVKMVSIVGPGGIGKTSLARQVCNKLQLQFECRAFVYVGRTTSVSAVLKNILNKVNRRQRDGFNSLDEHQLIQKLKGFLSDKKYFVVISDVCSLKVYHVIRGALPENNVGSRIMLTTCSYDLVRSSCTLHKNQVFEVKPLSSDDSKTLLLGTVGRILGPKKCSTSLKEACNVFLERYVSMPLAILVLAGTLASMSELDRWRQLAESYTISEEYFHTDEMRKILNIGYMTLPHHLKSCFLYLSVFPEKYIIQKGRLIRRWIGEGFISASGGESLLEIGESYLYELVIRNLIQQVSLDHIEQEECYIVHHTIHEFIVSLSAEENFVTVPGQWILPSMIRRLSLQYNPEFSLSVPSQYNNPEVALSVPSHTNHTVLSHNRSMTIFGCIQWMPDLSQFEYLRVLDLEDADKLKNHHLKNIGKLYWLKYLGLGGKDISKLPEQIGTLQHMQTLDVARTNIRELLATVVQWKMLHLLVSNVRLSSWVGHMNGIEELSLINITEDSSPQSMEELGKLNRLRILGVKWCINDKNSRITTMRDKFVNALKELGSSNLLSLTLDRIKGASLDFLVDGWPSTLKLQKFRLLNLNCYFKGIPQGMADTVGNLAHVEIGNTNIRDALEAFKGIPTLVTLKLRSGAAFSEQRCIIEEGEFQCLKELWLMRLDGRIVQLLFQKESMPQLQSLILQFSIWGAQSLDDDFPLGISQLPHLKRVHFMMNCEGAGVSEVKAAEEAIHIAISSKMYSDGAGVSEIETMSDAMKRTYCIRPIYEFGFSTHQEDKSIQCAFTANMNSIGAVFRSSLGYFRAAMSQSLNQESDDNNEIRAARACQEVLKFALKVGFKRVSFASDCKPLVNRINSDDEAPHPGYAKLFEDIKKLMDCFESLYLDHYPNAVEADKVANCGQHQHWIEHPPEFLELNIDA